MKIIILLRRKMSWSLRGQIVWQQDSGGHAFRLQFYYIKSIWFPIHIPVNCTLAKANHLVFVGHLNIMLMFCFIVFPLTLQRLTTTCSISIHFMRRELGLDRPHSPISLWLISLHITVHSVYYSIFFNCSHQLEGFYHICHSLFTRCIISIIPVIEIIMW